MCAARVFRFVWFAFMVAVMVTVMAAEALAAQSTVKSGDFVVLTQNTRSLFPKQGPIDFEGYRLSFISPAGSLRASVLLPGSDLATSSSGRQAAISPDGKFVFTTASNMGGPRKESIYVTSLASGSPKVVEALTPPLRKPCTLTFAAPIAVDGPDSNGNYAVYVSQSCYKCLGNFGGTSSFDVVKLRFSPSTGKLVGDAKKPYFAGRLNCTNYKSGKIYEFETLQVIEGKPYGLLFDSQKTLKLLKLNSPATLAGGSSSEFNDCGQSSFAIASPNQFYGLCSKVPFPKEAYRASPLSVVGGKVTKALATSAETYKGEDGKSIERFFWEGTPATKMPSRTAYVILQDRVNTSNNTLYKFDPDKFANPPVAIAKLDSKVLLPDNIDVATGGNVMLLQLLVIS